MKVKYFVLLVGTSLGVFLYIVGVIGWGIIHNPSQGALWTLAQAERNWYYLFLVVEALLVGMCLVEIFAVHHFANTRNYYALAVVFVGTLISGVINTTTLVGTVLLCVSVFFATEPE